MKVIDLFGTMRLGIPQSAGNMVVFPIISDIEDTEISGEMILTISRDTDYSRLTIKNIDEKPVIVPQGARFWGKGQERTNLSASIIGPESEKTLQVGCIEPSNAAHITIGAKDYSFIPARLRLPAIIKQNATNFQVLWKDIESYLNSSGLREGRALHVFYDNFQKELEEFVAQFEPVEKQIGAVIIINNQIAGIEIYPNYLAWSKIWRLLLRDSYGADAIALIRKKEIAAYKPIIDLDKIESFEELENEVKNIKADFLGFTKRLVDEILNEDVQMNVRETSSVFHVNNLQSQTMIGQLISKNEKVVYVSLLKNYGQRVLAENEVEEED